MKFLPEKANYRRLSAWLFVVVWLAGNLSMIAGFSAQGFWESFAATVIFAGICAAWWGTYRLSKFTNDGGFVVIGLWMLGPLMALLDFHDFRAIPFFWISSAVLLCLFSVAVLYKARAEQLDQSQSKANP